MDTEPTVINDIKAGKHRELFHPECTIGFKKDCKSNFFEGRTMAAAFKIQDVVMDRIRLTAELCENLQGFFVVHSVGGGTGSGVGVEILHDLKVGFEKKSIFEPVIYPSQHFSSSIVEPYNCILATHYSHELVDLSFMLDNEAIYNICSKNLQIKAPDFSHVNHIISQCLSGITGPLRYPTVLNATLNEIQANLVPTPRFRYSFMSLAPLRHSDRYAHEGFQTEEIVRELFDERNVLCDIVKLNSNRYLAAVLVLRGKGPKPTVSATGVQPTRDPESGVRVNDVTRTVNELREPPLHKTHVRAIKFLPWMGGSGLKMAIVDAQPYVPKTKNFPMAQSERQGVLIGNNTAIRQLFVRQYVRFLKLYFHKAYVWQFLTSNGDMDSFDEAKEGVRRLIDMYEELLTSCQEEENTTLAKAGTGTMKLAGQALNLGASSTQMTQRPTGHQR